MPTLAVELASLHPAQAEIAQDQARFKVLACGRRFGKTALCVDILTNGALDGYPMAYFAPTYKMTADVWREFKRVLRPIITYKNETDRRLELITGGIIDCWSLDHADSVRGRKYKGIVVDEAAMIPDGTIWPSVLRPLLLDLTGWALFPSTPKGMNWFWELYNQGMDPLFENWSSWNFPSSSNPYLPPEEIAEAQATSPDRWFRQEYLAEFVDDAGGVFRGVDAVSTAGEERQPTAGRTYVFGVDWGRSYDFTTISIFDVEARRQVFLDRFNQVNWAIQRGRLRNLYDLWQPRAIYAESNSIGEVNIEALQAEGLPMRSFQTTAQSKGPLIDGLALAIERREITLLNNPVQKMELKAYQMERLPSGIYRYGAPAGGHDDTVIGTALAWHGIVNHPISVVFGIAHGLYPERRGRSEKGRR